MKHIVPSSNYFCWSGIDELLEACLQKPPGSTALLSLAWPNVPAKDVKVVWCQKGKGKKHEETAFLHVLYLEPKVGLYM